MYYSNANRINEKYKYEIRLETEREKKKMKRSDSKTEKKNVLTSHQAIAAYDAQLLLYKLNVT